MYKTLLATALLLAFATNASLAGSLPTLATGVTKGQKPSPAIVSATGASSLVDLTFVPLTPCRLVDTRPAFSANGPLLNGSTTTFHAIGSTFAAQGGAAFDCGVPTGAVAIAVNIAMLHTKAAGDVRMWAAGQTMPLAAVGVFSSETNTGVTFDGASAIVPICHSGCPAEGEFSVYAENSDLDLTVDVSGYFRPSVAATNGAGQGLNWGTISRNTIGSATAQLRNDGSAPSGTGALQLTVGTGNDKIAFGNEVDFAGQSLANLTAVSYQVKTFDENSSGHPNGNMPALYIEINPNDGNATYSTLNYSPTVNATGNTWSLVDAFADTSNAWSLTGSYYNADPNNRCGLNGNRCTLAQIKAQLPNATIMSVAIGKGRDYPWVGEVDALRINDTIYDFEAQGVVSIPVP
jgi:hypothetical protein